MWDAQSSYLRKTFVSSIAHQQKLNWRCRVKCCCCWEKLDSSPRNPNWYRQLWVLEINLHIPVAYITVDICGQKFTMEISPVVQCRYLIMARCTEGRPEVRWGRMMGVQAANVEALWFTQCFYSISNISMVYEEVDCFIIGIMTSGSHIKASKNSFYYIIY